MADVGTAQDVVSTATLYWAVGGVVGGAVSAISAVWALFTYTLKKANTATQKAHANELETLKAALKHERDERVEHQKKCEERIRKLEEIITDHVQNRISESKEQIEIFHEQTETIRELSRAVSGTTEAVRAMHLDVRSIQQRM
jgi:type IV secretory pathway VirB4 component